MEEKKSPNFDRNRNGFAAPEQDVASTKNKSCSATNNRGVESDGIGPPPVPAASSGKSNESPPFLDFATDNASASSYGDIASPQSMTMEQLRSEPNDNACQQATMFEKSQVVIAGLMCFLKQPRYKPSPRALGYSTKETLEHAMGRATGQSTKVNASMGPYLNGDGTFKNLRYFHDLYEGLVIYARMESVYALEKGQLLGSNKDVFLSKCGKYVLKKRIFSKKTLDAWRQLTDCDHVMPLSGVLMADSGYIYQVTKRMQCDLREARQKVTLKYLASVQSDHQWAHTRRNYAHIVRSILEGIIHLNKHGHQHYDIKEDNALVNKPMGCECLSILECTCVECWEIRIGDFDTLSEIARPERRKSGTKFYRPPESEAGEYDLTYEHPTCDSWSVLVILLHFCCGTAMRESERQKLEMPWLQNQECHYAKDRLIELFQSCGPRLLPVAQLAAKCLQTDFKRRPTPQEMLTMWDELCI